jgi:hypothetical protein
MEEQNMNIKNRILKDLKFRLKTLEEAYGDLSKTPEKYPTILIQYEARIDENRCLIEYIKKVKEDDEKKEKNYFI